MRTLQTGMVLALALLLHGCGVTPQTRYYVLDSNPQVAPSGARGVAVGVGPVAVAEYLDRAQITLKQNNALTIDEYHRWGEPLSTGITRVLLSELAVNLDSQNLVQFPWRADQVPDLRLKMHVLELNREGSNAVIKASWSIGEIDSGEQLQQGVEIVRTPLANQDYVELVAGYSHLLEELAKRISVHVHSASEYFVRSRVESPLRQ